MTALSQYESGVPQSVNVSRMYDVCVFCSTRIGIVQERAVQLGKFNSQSDRLLRSTRRLSRVEVQLQREGSLNRKKQVTCHVCIV